MNELLTYMVQPVIVGAMAGGFGAVTGYLANSPEDENWQGRKALASVLRAMVWGYMLSLTGGHWTAIFFGAVGGDYLSNKVYKISASATK